MAPGEDVLYITRCVLLMENYVALINSAFQSARFESSSSDSPGPGTYNILSEWPQKSTSLSRDAVGLMAIYSND